MPGWKTFAVGDVHGKARQLEQLLDLLRPRAGAGDTLVFLGDLISRGEDSCGVNELVLRERIRWPGARIVVLIGNHELELREALRQRDRTTWKSYLRIMGGEATVRSYGQSAPFDLETFAAALPASHRKLLMDELDPWWEDEHGIYVHGGFPPDRHPADVSEETLTNYPSDGCRYPVGSLGKPVVFGHTVCRDGRPLDAPDRIGLDTGAGVIAGAPLTAVILPEREFTSVR